VTVCGGVIPVADEPALRSAGVADVFGPGTPIVVAIGRLLDRLELRGGVSAPAVAAGSE
jgi:methylmalonyl-CoA mutase cobalamin-binding domain/chain